MGNVKRIYVEKKDSFAVKARELEEELKGYLGIDVLDKVRIFILFRRNSKNKCQPASQNSLKAELSTVMTHSKNG